MTMVDCKHYVDVERIWCPPMCPCQASPRPSTGRARRRMLRGWKRDGTYRLQS